MKAKSSPVRAADPGEGEFYRTFNRAAVGSVVMAVLSLTGFMFSVLLMLAVAGILLGLSAYRTIRRYPEEYTGLGTAKAGLLISALVLCSGIAYHSYVYATEVPEGFTRVSFSELQPDGFKAGPLIPKRALELSGEKIFIKGYMHPGVGDTGKVDQFVLVPDMGTCCFGGQPKLTDMILVTTDKAMRRAYSRQMMGLPGTFAVGDQATNFAGVNGVLYRLDVKKLEEASP